MKLHPDALISHLDKGLAPLYVVVGDEYLLVQEAIDLIRKVASARGFVEREILVVERHFKWVSLSLVRSSQSLFGDKKIFEIRIPSGKPGKEGSEALQSLCKVLDTEGLVIITLPKLDWTTQKAAWVMALQQAGIYIEIAQIDRAQLPRWIEQRLRMQEQQTDDASLNFLADCVEGNLLAAHQEIQKLALLYPSGKISIDQIQQSVSNVARYDVFKLPEAILAGDVVRFSRILNGLNGEGETLPLVLWVLAEEIRILLKLKIAMREGQVLSALLKSHRIWGARAGFVEAALMRLSEDILRTALHEAAQIDRMIKGLTVLGTTGCAWNALLQLGFRIANCEAKLSISRGS